jgi:hypothetical protein
VVSEAVELRERTEQEAAQVSRKVNGTQKSAGRGSSGARKSSPRTSTQRTSSRRTRAKGQGVLEAMPKSDLLHLAQEREVPGRSSMSKKQLVTALEKKQ